LRLFTIDQNPNVPIAHNPLGVSLPGVTSQTQQITQTLLEKNHQKYNIFFNKSGFHNHLTHHVLAAYSLGATPDILKKIYDIHAGYQKPLPPNKVTKNRVNWKDHLGENDLYTDYLNFFDKIIKEDGLAATFEKYAFDPHMLPRLVSGALHPIIHVGYGIEFNEPIILAEGLASTAIHTNRMGPLLNEDFFEDKGDYNITINDIIKEICNDSRFDNVLQHSEDGKLNLLLQRKLDVVREYAQKWGVQETEQGVNDRLKELYEATVMAYGATAQRPDKKKTRLDFFLMHGVTSALFVKVLLKDISLPHKVALLRAHFAAVLTYYISRGRPQLYPELLYKYTSKELNQDPNPWLDVIKQASLSMEVHVLKTVRALMKADEEWGGGEQNIFLKVAQLTVDSIRNDNDWCFDGVGFDEEWK
jgi:hypothetical protein